MYSYTLLIKYINRLFDLIKKYNNYITIPDDDMDAWGLGRVGFVKRFLEDTYKYVRLPHATVIIV